MLILDFQPDLAEVHELRENDARNADAGLLQEIGLAMPVRLRVGDVDLLENNIPDPARTWIYDPLTGAVVVVPQDPVTSSWLRLPILSVAIAGLQVVEESIQRGTGTYYLPGGRGDLYFHRSGNEMRVSFSDYSRTGHAPVTEVSDAFVQFSSKVRRFLSQELPELAEHPQLGRWMRMKADTR